MTGAADLRDLLARLPVPAEEAARERSAAVVAQAFAARRTRRGAHRRLVLVAAGLLVLAFAASALASGGAVTRWVRDLVGPAPPARPLGALPAPGRLLVTGAGGAWVIDADGRRHEVGDFGDASWSPHGLFVVGVDGRRLVAVTPTGEERWSLVATTPVRAARWSTGGYRIAYATGTDVRVVAGDGSGDHAVGARSKIAPAWRPDRSHVLAFVTSAGALVVSRVDHGSWGVRARGLGAATWIGWADRRRVLVATPGALVAVAPDGTRRRWRAPPGSRVVAAAVAPSGRRAAVLLRRGSTSRIVIVDDRAMRATRTILPVRGATRDLVWSPDGRWLATALPRQGRWLLAPTTGRGRPHALTGLAAAFGAPAARARPRGWCCAALR